MGGLSMVGCRKSRETSEEMQNKAAKGLWPLGDRVV